MFDIGWSEMFVVAVVAIIVVGPKDLPKMLRTIGKTVGNLKRMAGDFQSQFDDALKEAELDEVKNLAKGEFAPLEDIKKATSEFDADFKKTIAERDAELKQAANSEIEAPAVTSKVKAGGETEKLLAEKRAKDIERMKSSMQEKARKATLASEKAADAAAASKPETSAKKTSAKKPAAKKPSTRKSTPKKPAPKKASKTGSKSKKKATS